MKVLNDNSLDITAVYRILHSNSLYGARREEPK